ncbi:MAG: stage V sporulation protein AC [Clostridia bacterium]|nr:stage V sporulation protein AC [Clostridia bacterium]MDD4386163.1 stage V sporulation protein AC [Clostridia bacterium]
MEEDKIKMTNKEYSEYVDGKAKKSPIIKNIIFAFISGGFICVIGQIITNICVYYKIEVKDAATISIVSLIFLGAFLTSIHVYSRIGKYAGAGSVIPITGFSNSIVAPAIEYKSEGYVLGLGANMFKIAGPVLVYGIFSSFIVGFIYWLMLFVR